MAKLELLLKRVIIMLKSAKINKVLIPKFKLKIKFIIIYIDNLWMLIYIKFP